MKDKLLYFTKITSSSVFSFVKINLLASISTVLVFLIGFFLLIKGLDPGHSGHVSAIPFLVMTIFAKPLTSILFYLVILASPFVFFTLGNKYILSKIIHRILEDKSESYIDPVLDKLLLKVKVNTTSLVANKEGYNAVKEKLITQLKNENENKWIKRIVSYGLTKANLDDVDFGQENLSFVEIMKTKIMQALKDISKPSRKIIWICLLIQWVVLLLIWILPI